MKKIVFFTVASDQYQKYADMMINSFKHFCDFPLIHFGQKEIDEAIKAGYQMGALYPYFGAQLIEDYDLVISIEPDSIVCGQLDELLNLDLNVVGVCHNNLDETYGLHTREMSRTKYINSGLVASGSSRFWKLWRDKARDYAKHYRFVEQDVLNYLIAYNDFDVKYLDSEGVFYGSSARNLWHTLRVENDKLICGDRVVKVLHWAGGSQGKMDWYGRKFDPTVCQYLDKLAYEKNKSNHNRDF